MFKIVLTGPESSGKTTLAEALSVRVRVDFVPEFARAYLSNLARNYQSEDLLTIASGQMLWILQAANNCPSLLIVDTDIQNIDLWQEIKYGAKSAQIDQFYSLWRPDLYVLCQPDMAWQPDSLREAPDTRDAIFDIYQRDMSDKNLRHIIVGGTIANRVEQVLTALTVTGKELPNFGAKQSK
ncbi:MAG: ATP-binding protein [Saprospiraceae bacterium]